MRTVEDAIAVIRGRDYDARTAAEEFLARCMILEVAILDVRSGSEIPKKPARQKRTAVVTEKSAFWDAGSTALDLAAIG